MITVAQYASREEAYVAKALLEAADVQVFLDDGQYADTKTIAIRVPERQAAEARSILSDREETISGTNGGEGEAGRAPKREATDMLLFIKGGAIWIFGYILVGLVLRVFGILIPFTPIPLGLIFLVGGLVGLIFGKTGPKSSAPR